MGPKKNSRNSHERSKKRSATNDSRNRKQQRSKQSVKKQFLTMKSMKKVSEVGLSDDKEVRLLQLLGSLNGITIKLVDDDSSENSEQSDDNYSGWDNPSSESDSDSNTEDSDNDDGNDNDDIDEVSSDSESLDSERNVLPSTNQYIGDFMKSLVRTDRFERKLARSSDEISAEKVAAKLRNIINAMSSKVAAHISSKSARRTVAVSELIAASEVSESTRAKMGSTVRLTIQCDKSKAKSTIAVIDRLATIVELLPQIRSKFNVGKKYNTLLWIAPVIAEQSIKKKEGTKSGKSGKSGKLAATVETRVLTESDLLNMEDGATVILAMCDISKPQRGDQENIDDAEMSVLVDEQAVNIENKAKTMTAEDDEQTVTIAHKVKALAEYEEWTPPKYQPQDRFATKPLSRDITESSLIERKLLAAQCGRFVRESLNLTVVDERQRDEDIRHQRRSLPIFRKRVELLEMVRNHRVILVCGETGSGKSTQLPQMILEDMVLNDHNGSMCNIVVAQPRRIAAVSLAARVHDELYASCGVSLRDTAEEEKVEKEVTRDQEQQYLDIALSRLECLDAQIPFAELESKKSKSVKCTNVTDDKAIGKISELQRQQYLSALTAEQSPSLGKGLVGYSVRLESRISENTRLLYCTTGILLRKLQDDEYLKSVSHIVLDEVHERGVEMDFLMTIVKQKMEQFSHLKVILMSATLQEETFRDYFNAPVIHVSGRTFPVDIQYLETIQKHVVSDSSRRRETSSFKDKKSSNIPVFDAEKIADVVQHIITNMRQNLSNNNSIPVYKQRGEAILIFLSGIHAIEKTAAAIRGRKSLQRSFIRVHRLHGTLPPEQQQRVFRPTAPGEWKIVLATNIAETSITVDDVTHVIDTGFVKEQCYDPASGIHALKEVFVSRASANQRAGRAGRVRPGICWRLFSQEFFNTNATTQSPGVKDFGLPEIQRVALEEVILQVLLLNLGQPEQFLMQCLSPPTLPQIMAALACLVELKAIRLSSSGLFALTALGYHLAQLPMDVRIGKMLLWSTLLNCTEEALTVAAALSVKSPFIAPFGDGEQREMIQRKQKQFLRYREYTPPDQMNAVDPLDPYPNGDNVVHCRSDHIAIVHAVSMFQRTMNEFGKNKAYEFCIEYGLSFSVMRDIMALRDYYKEFLRNNEWLATADVEMEANYSSSSKKMETLSLTESKKATISPMSVLSTKKNQFSQVIVEDTAESTFDRDMLRCALCAGLWPNVVRAFRVDSRPPTVKIVQKDSKELSFHATSLLNGQIKELISGDQQDAFLVYHHQMETGGRLNIFDATVIPHSAVLLFAGNEIVQSNPGKKKNARFPQRIVVSKWIEMNMSELHLACYRRLAKEIEQVLRQKAEDPQRDFGERLKVIQSAIKILLHSDEDDE